MLLPFRQEGRGDAGTEEWNGRLPLSEVRWPGGEADAGSPNGIKMPKRKRGALLKHV